MSAKNDKRDEKMQSAEGARAARLKAALKANIAKRKLQARARSAPDRAEDNDKA